MLLSGYLLIVGAAAWYSNSNPNTTTPTADQLAALPGGSLGTTAAIIGAAGLMFAGRIAAKV